MAGKHLAANEKRALLLWVLAAVVGLWFAHRYFFQAFPEASIHFSVSRGEALQRAEQFLKSNGNSVDGYRSAIIFSVDADAKVYLEREMGLQQANHLMSQELSIWYWDIRFFKPQQEEEFRVQVSPDGRVVAFEHKVPEAKGSATLSQSEAQQIAQTFLTSQLGKDAANWEFLPEEAGSTKRSNRLDWSFTWEKRGFKAKEAVDRLKIGLQGNQVGSADEFLKVPEAWQRSYEHLRSANTFYNQVAVIPYLFVFALALWAGITFARRGLTSWSAAIKLGIIIAIFLFAMQLNRWPIDLHNYDTNSSFGSFKLMWMLSGLIFALGSALTTTLVLPGGELFYRASQPYRLQLYKLLTLRGMRTEEFFSSTVVGLCMAAAHMGFLVAFYLVANHFGAWAPMDMSYDDSVSTIVPWIAGVAIAMLAATSEEFLFRLFAIPFLKRVTGSTLIAVILPAFSWGFLHAAYPNEPPYIRGLEVGLIGIVAGLVMLRWGILATLVWHYTVDASLVGLLLIRSESLYFKIAGIVVGLAALIPLAYCVISYFRRGGFAEDADMQNGAALVSDVAFWVPLPEAGTSHSSSTRTYKSLPKAVLATAVVLGICGIVFAAKWHPNRIGDYLQLSANARQAKQFADTVLRDRHIDPAAYHSATTLVNVTNPLANEFLKERIGVQRLNEIYNTQIPGALWSIRYFQDGNPEEYSVILKPDGSLHSVHHTLAEAAKGASLSQEEAVARARRYLYSERKLDVDSWTLVEDRSDKRPNRIDHKLVWQNKTPLNPGTTPENSAYARIDTYVLGDEVTDYRTYIKLPDEWTRQQNEQKLGATLFSITKWIFIFAFAITIFVFFLKQMKSELARSIPWRSLAAWAAWIALGFLVSFFFGDRIATVMDTYQTSMPLKFIWGVLFISGLIGLLIYFGGYLLLYGMSWYFGARALGPDRMPRWLGMPRSYYFDALVIGLGGTGILVGLSRLVNFISEKWTTSGRGIYSAFGSDFAALLPSASILGTSLLRAFLLVAILAVIATFVASHVKSTVLRLFLLLLAILASCGSWTNFSDFLKQLVTGALLVVTILLLVRYVVRLNLLGGFLLAFTVTTAGAAVTLLQQPNSFYKSNGYIVLAVTAMVFLWTAFQAIRQPKA